MATDRASAAKMLVALAAHIGIIVRKCDLLSIGDNRSQEDKLARQLKGPIMTIESIIVENYRGFYAETQLNVKPITILIGRNSSGKSSLVRLVPLLQQSISTASSAPLLWDGELVDLGTMSDIVSRKNPDSDLKIGFLMSAHNFSSDIRSRSRFFYYHDEDDDRADDVVNLKYVMRLRNKAGKTYFSGITIVIENQTMSLNWDSDGLVDEVEIDGKEYPLADLELKVSAGDLVPSITRAPSPSRQGVTLNRRPFFYPPFADSVEDVLHGRLQEDKADFISSRLGFHPREKMKEQLLRLPHIVKRKATEVKAIEISNLSMINHLPEILEYIKSEVRNTFLNSAYIGPARASTERFDRIQELAVNRLTSGGENTAMYLHSMQGKDAESFNRLMHVATGHSVKTETSGPNHVSILVSTPESSDWENVADVGFGFSQVIPVVAQLHAVSERRVEPARNAEMSGVYAVEQPELHLHPAMQGKLSDLFACAIKEARVKGLGLRILAETHSQNIVSSLGLMVAGGEVAAEDVSIVFVEKDSATGESKLRNMIFDGNGEIADWPLGFFSA